MNDNEVYTVTREGVYRHEIVGIYNDLEDAKKWAVEAVKSISGYHDYWVMRCPMNEVIEDGKLIMVISINAETREVYIV